MVFERNRLEEIAKQGDQITVKLSLANVPIFTFEIPKQSKNDRRFTLKKLAESKDKKAFKKIDNAARDFIRKEYKQYLLETTPDMDSPVCLSSAGDDDRSPLYDVTCTYFVLLKPKEKEIPYTD